MRSDPVPTQPPPTLPPRLWGDVNCDNVVNSVDALTILRWKSQVSVIQGPLCPVIGTVVP